MARLGPYDTQQLTRQRLELSARRRGHAGLLAALVVAAGLGAFVLAPRLLDSWPAGVASTLRAENALLRDRIEQLRTELAIERAARAGLEGQVANLGGELADANRQLDFLTVRGARAPDRP